MARPDADANRSEPSAAHKATADARRAAADPRRAAAAAQSPPDYNLGQEGTRSTIKPDTTGAGRRDDRGP
jgi:hypothetical protein